MSLSVLLFVDRAAAALALSGVAFDPADPRHQEADALRYAEWIQQARDAGDYARADGVRAMVIGFGAVVRLGKRSTFVLDGDLRPDMSIVPHSGGYAEWVSPEDVRGRHVLEACFHGVDRGGGVHSCKVANWREHPNLALARERGLPDALWTADGQNTLAFATDTAWFFAQNAAIRRTLIERRVGEVEASLLEAVG